MTLRKTAIRLLAGVTVVVLFAGPSLGEAFIVEDGAPKAEIVIAKNPPRTTGVAGFS